MHHAVARRGIFYGWLVVGAAAFLSLLTVGSRSGFGLFIDVWSSPDGMGWDRGAISLAAAIGMLASGVAAPLLGRVYDRVGGRQVILWSLLALGAGTLLQSLINSILLLVVTYGFIVSVAMSGVSGSPLNALVSKWFRRQRGKALSIEAAGKSLGALILVPFTAYLLMVTNWRVTWAVLGAMVLLLGLPVAWLILRNEPKDMGLLPDGDVEGDPSGAADRGRRLRAPLETERWQDSYRSPPVWQLSAAYFVCGATTGILHVHFVPYVVDQGYSKGMAAMAFGVMGAMNLVGVLAVGTLSDRLGRKDLLALVYLVRGLAYVVLLLVPGPLAIWGAAVIAGTTWLATVPLSNSLTAEVYGLKNLGTISGMMAMTHQAGSALSIYLGGLFYQLYGSYTISFAIAGALLLGASMVSFSIRERRYSVRYRAAPAAVSGPAD